MSRPGLAPASAMSANVTLPASAPSSRRSRPIFGPPRTTRTASPAMTGLAGSRKRRGVLGADAQPRVTGIAEAARPGNRARKQHQAGTGLHVNLFGTAHSAHPSVAPSTAGVQSSTVNRHDTRSHGA